MVFGIIRKKDIILITILVVVLGSALLIMNHFRSVPSKESNLYIRYSIDGVYVDTLPLTEETDLSVEPGEDELNVLHLTPQGFSMIFSTCYNQLCVHQGEVTLENMSERPLYHMIVCAPHRLVAELLTEDQLGEE